MSAAAARASRETLLDGFPSIFLYVVDDSRESDGPGLVGLVDDEFITSAGIDPTSVLLATVARLDC